MSTNLYHLINILILFSVLAWVLKKKLGAYFTSERERLEGEVKSAGETHARVLAEYESMKTAMNSLESRLAEMRSTSLKEIELESKRIELDTARTIEKITQDTEARMRTETERMKRSLERELFDAALSSAKSSLKQEMKKADADWVGQMIQQEASRSGKKNYAS